MRFSWTDYTGENVDIVESWMDEDTLRFLGCQDGWTRLVEERYADEHYRKGVNFWIKVVSEEGVPVAAISLYWMDEGATSVTELVVKPSARGKGLGTEVLKELLSSGEQIVGKEVLRAGAVVFPSNTAAVKAFTRAGFHFDSIHPDGDIWIFKYDK